MYPNLWRKWPNTKGEARWPYLKIHPPPDIEIANCSKFTVMDDVGGDIDVDMIDIGAAFPEARLFACVM